MGRIHVSQSPLTFILTNFRRLHMDKFFRLFVCIWAVLLTLVGIYTWHAVEKSIDSYERPDRSVASKVWDHIPFPPLVFCASNSDSAPFAPAGCRFAQKGPAQDPILDCDITEAPLTLEVFDMKLQHQCVVVRGVKASASPTPSPLDEGVGSGAVLLETGQDGADGQHPLAGRTVANATYPTTQFQLYFDQSQSTPTFKHVLFHAVVYKTVTENEKPQHRNVRGFDPNPIYVPSSVDAWTRLYPERTEVVTMKLSTVTYLDETVVYKHNIDLRPVPCTLPDGESCQGKISVNVRYLSLEVESIEEVVTFDWLYVLGATGGALTVAEIVFMIVHPAAQRLLFGKPKAGEESDDDDDDDTYQDNRDPLIQ